MKKNKQEQITEKAEFIRDSMREDGMNVDKSKQPIIRVIEIDGQEHETLECPYCGGVVTEYHEPNGEDDYNRHAECKSCGAEWSE